MNRQQRRERERMQAAMRRMDKKAYAKLKARQERMGEVEVELYFTGIGLALHELYGFGQQRVGRVWKRTDELITELRDKGGRFDNLDEMKKLLKDQINLECSFR